MKKEIIQRLSELEFLDNNHFIKSLHGEAQEDLEFCLDVFRNWCKILNIKYSYSSFYEFLL